jgi:hypothetical protein
MTTKIEPIAWMYENQNVKEKWYLVWTEPSELGFRQVPLFTADQLAAAVAEEIKKLEQEIEVLKKRIGPPPRLPGGFVWNHDGTVTKTETTK